MVRPNLQAIIWGMEMRGYVVFDRYARGYNLNVVGVRSRTREAGAFDDLLTCFYRDADAWAFFAFPATTDPGVYWLENPMMVEGTAVLKPGQYRGAYELGFHRELPALVQRSNVTVYRDDDRDNLIDTDARSIERGLFGINIHRAGEHSTRVGKWSAGCQVIADAAHAEFFFDLCSESRDRYGPGLTYTLLTENDLSTRR